MERMAGAMLVLMLLAGCATTPALNIPPEAKPTVPVGEESNPLFTGLSGGDAYNKIVFERVLTALSEEGFELQDYNRYDGRIKTRPRVKPGLVQPFVPGSTEFYDRLLATFQSYRHWVQVKIEPASPDLGGYMIFVQVFEELEDLPRPVRATAGAVLYSRENNIERQFFVVDPTQFENNWIPKGRDHLMEQSILHRLRELL